jgi:hypothetical protein
MNLGKIPKTQVVLVGTLAVLLLAHWNLSKKLYRDQLTDEEFLKAAPLIDLDTRLLDILSFGHRGLYDDFVAIWMLQILTDPRLKNFPPEEVQQMLVRVGRHKPLIETFYLLGCFVLTFDLKRPDLCEPLMRQGTEAFPRNWRIPVTMGIIAAHHLHDNALASLYYGIGAQRDEVPEYIQKTATRLAKEQNIDPSDLQKAFDMILQKPAIHGEENRPSKLLETLERRQKKP